MPEGTKGWSVTLCFGISSVRGVAQVTADHGNKCAAKEDGGHLREGRDGGPGALPTYLTPALTVSWKRPPARRRREIIVSNGSEDVRPIRAETRATLVRSIAVGRRWLQEIVDSSSAGPDEIAARESCSRRHVMMMISLAFLAPDLVAAAMQGRLPGGIGVTRLIDAPIEWSRQWHMLGL